jgi:hypothetical protein
MNCSAAYFRNTAILASLGIAAYYTIGVMWRLPFLAYFKLVTKRHGGFCCVMFVSLCMCNIH